MGVTVAAPEHAAVVARLLYDFNTEFIPPRATVEEFEGRFRRLLNHPEVLVLISGTPEEPLGFALVTTRPSPCFDGPLAVLDELYIVPHLRGRGLGGELLDEMEARLRERECGEIHINVDEDDVDARRFYEAHGYSDTEVGSEYRMFLYAKEFPASGG